MTKHKTTMSFMETVREKVKGRGTRVVYPEGLEERAIKAAAWLRDRELVVPILVGAADQVRAKAKALDASLDGIDVRDPASDPRREDFVAEYVELRKHEGITPEQAQKKVSLPHYFGALAVRAGEADGMVSGLNSETKPFLPSFEIIKVAEGYKRVSSVFIMTWPDKTYFYSDCSVNISPDAETLAEIGRAAARTASLFGFEPRVAYLSFSTRDSAQDVSIDRMKEAVALLRKAEPELLVDGELQFDAATVPEITQRKSPDSPLEGRANVFIFPDLNAGNIAYKITERLRGAAAIGPILQGLRKPMNDVSRACTVQDLADVATITALQSMG